MKKSKTNTTPALTRRTGRESGVESFIATVVDMARRALKDRVGLRVVIVEDGGDASAELHLNGKTLTMQTLNGVQLALPGVVATTLVPNAGTTTATATATSAPASASPTATTTATTTATATMAPAPEAAAPKATRAPFVVLSAVVDGDDIAAWAVKHSLVAFGSGAAAAWVCWHIEGGAPRVDQSRAVTVVRREMLPELDVAATEAGVEITARDASEHCGGDSVLRAGAVVMVDQHGWTVAAIEAHGTVILADDMMRITVPFGRVETIPDGSGRFRVVAEEPKKAPKRRLPVVTDAAPPTRPQKGNRAPKARAEKVPPKGKELARLQELREADRLAETGTHTAVYSNLGGTWKRELRAAKATAPEWRATALGMLSGGNRVRVYNGGRKCTWDSNDGGSPR